MSQAMLNTDLCGIEKNLEVAPGDDGNIVMNEHDKCHDKTAALDPSGKEAMCYVDHLQ